MRKQIITCDGCGKEKGETNHWFTIPYSDSRFVVMKGVDAHALRHFCSQGCVSAAFQQWMDTETA